MKHLKNGNLPKFGTNPFIGDWINGLSESDTESVRMVGANKCFQNRDVLYVFLYVKIFTLVTLHLYLIKLGEAANSHTLFHVTDHFC